LNLHENSAIWRPTYQPHLRAYSPSTHQLPEDQGRRRKTFTAPLCPVIAPPRRARSTLSGAHATGWTNRPRTARRDSAVAAGAFLSGVAAAENCSAGSAGL
jgi:hypothetical protein